MRRTHFLFWMAALLQLGFAFSGGKGLAQPNTKGFCGTPILDANAEEIVQNTLRLAPELPRQLARPKKAEYEVGDTLKFYVDNMATNSVYQISAVCRSKSLRTYIFVGLEEWNAGKVSQTDVDNFERAFERETPPQSIDPTKGIRDIETSLFGPPPNKSGDGYVYILIYDIKDNYDPSAGKTLYVAGYFNPRDQGNGIYSNKKDLLYVDCDPGRPSSKTTLATIAHEFQHLIHYGRDPDEDLAHQGTWVNEGCSMYAEYITGYGLADPSRYLRHPDRSLTGWNYGGEDVDIDYAKVALYFYYLHEKFGPPLISEIVKDKLHGVAGVADAMKKQGVPISFDDVFTNFAVANYADNPNLDPNGYYGYTNYDLPTMPAVSKTHNVYPVDRQGKSLRRYATSYYRFTLADSTAELHFEGEGNRPIRAMIFEEGLHEAVYPIELDSSHVGKVKLSAIGKTANETVLIPVSLKDPTSFFYSVTTSIEDIWPPQITSGPMESLPTNTTTTIFWETDERSTSIVEYGETPEYGQKVESDELVVEHRVLLTGLKPSTTYHYRVGSVDHAGNGPSYSADFTFTTSSAQQKVIATVQQAHTYGYEGRSLARDSQGTLHLVYHEKINDRRFVYHIKSSDNGQTWSAPVQIDTSLYYGGMPSLAIDSQDRIHVTWHAQAVKNAKFKIYYSRSDDGGQTWSPPVAVSNTIQNYDQLYASIATDTNDNPHIVWNTALYTDNYRGDVRYAHSTDGGQTWEADQEISISESHLCFVPTIQFTSENRAYVLYTDGSFDQHQRNAYYITSDDFQNWTSPKPISTSGVLYDGMVSFVIDSADRVHAVFSDNYVPGDIRIMYTRGYKTDWTSPVPVASSITGGNVSYPNISVDAQNNLYLAYRDNMSSGQMGKLARLDFNEEQRRRLHKPGQTENGDIFLTVWRDGSWLPAVNLSNDPYDSRYPELPLQASENAVDLVWVNAVTASTNQITFLHFSTTGAAPPAPPVVSKTYPENGAADIPYFSAVLKIWAQFDQRIVADSLIPGNVIVRSAKRGLVSGEISYVESQRKFVFVPSENLLPEDTVTVTLTANIRSIFGLPLDGNGNGRADGSPEDDYTWKFVTRPPDHDPPQLTIGVLQNPVLTRYLDVYVVSSEALMALPSLTIGGAKITLVEINPEAYIYKGDYKLSQSGMLALHAEGRDFAGNLGTTDKGFSAQLFLAGTGGTLLSADGRLELILPPGEFSQDQYLTVVKQPAGVAGTPHSTAQSEVYFVGPSSLKLSIPAELRFRVVSANTEGKMAAYRIERRTEAGTWEPLPTSLRGHFAVAQVHTLGIFRIREQEDWVPQQFALRQNFPNPFSGRTGGTTFIFDLPRPANVSLTVYNALGQRVRTLLSGFQPPGRYRLHWDGRDEAGRLVPSGLYFIRYHAADKERTKKLLILQ